MDLQISTTKAENGKSAAEKAATLIRAAIAAKGEASLILATGASQFEMLAHLVTLDIKWSRVTTFHLDEYIGLPVTHPASFRKYLNERFVQKVQGLKAFYGINGEHSDPIAECQRVGEVIIKHPVDVACVGIGENGHLAFNDPPADFTVETPYLVVNLDDACRRQQLGEGWFTTLSDVPVQAISMSIRQIMKSSSIVCTVPDSRKGLAVKNTVEGPVTNQVPASILQQHPHCWLFLDNSSSALLRRNR